MPFAVGAAKRFDETRFEVEEDLAKARQFAVLLFDGGAKTELGCVGAFIVERVDADQQVADALKRFQRVAVLREVGEVRDVLGRDFGVHGLEQRLLALEVGVD